MKSAAKSNLRIFHQPTGSSLAFSSTGVSHTLSSFLEDCYDPTSDSKLDLILLLQRFFKERWTLKSLAVNKTINLDRIDLAKKIRICDVITLIFIYIVTS